METSIDTNEQYLQLQANFDLIAAKFEAGEATWQEVEDAFDALDLFESDWEELSPYAEDCEYRCCGNCHCKD